MTFSRMGSTVGTKMIQAGNLITKQATYGAIGGFGILGGLIGTGAAAVPAVLVAPLLFKVTLGYGAAGVAMKGTGHALTRIFQSKIS